MLKLRFAARTKIHERALTEEFALKTEQFAPALFAQAETYGNNGVFCRKTSDKIHIIPIHTLTILASFHNVIFIKKCFNSITRI